MILKWEALDIYLHYRFIFMIFKNIIDTKDIYSEINVNYTNYTYVVVLTFLPGFGSKRDSSSQIQNQIQSYCHCCNKHCGNKPESVPCSTIQHIVVYLRHPEKKHIYMTFSLILKIVKESKCIVDLYLCPWHAAHVRPTFCWTVKAWPLL